MINKRCILYVTYQLNAAGAERYVLDIATYLSKRGHRIKIITLGCIDNRFLKNFDTNGIKIIHVPTFSTTKLFSLKSILVIYHLIRYIRLHNIEFIHLNQFVAEIIGGIAAILTARPFLLTQHNILPKLRNNSLVEAIYRFMQQFIMYSASCIIAPSVAVKKYLIISRKIPRNKVKVIYHGIDFDRFQIKPKKPSSIVNIGIIGRLREVKGHKYIIRALPIVLARIQKKKITLHLAGTGSMYQKILQEVKKLHLEKSVKFRNVVYDIPTFLTEMHIIVNTTVVGEGFGYVLIEALASSKAVITTNLGSAPEFIQDHYNGILVPPKSAEAIADALFELITNHKVFESITQNAAVSCRPFFSIERMMKETQNLYMDILHNQVKTKASV